MKILSLNKPLIFIILALLITSSYGFSQRKVIKVLNHELKTDEWEEIYVGATEIIDDSLSPIKVKRVLIFKKHSYKLHLVTDTIIQSPKKWDYIEGYTLEPIYGWGASTDKDSTFVLLSDSIFYIYGLEDEVIPVKFTDMEYLVGVPKYRYMKFTHIWSQEIANIDTISTLRYKSLTWHEIRTLPIRPFIEKKLKKLGKKSDQYINEVRKPMEWNEIVRELKKEKGDGLNELSKRGINPYEIIADITKAKLMLPYYRANINNPDVEDIVLLHIEKMAMERVLELKEKTGWDIRRDRNYNNLIHWHSTTATNPDMIDTTLYQHMWSGKEMKLNPQGQVTVSLFLIQPNSLRALIKNLDYAMRKKNWMEK